MYELVLAIVRGCCTRYMVASPYMWRRDAYTHASSHLAVAVMPLTSHHTRTRPKHARPSRIQYYYNVWVLICKCYSIYLATIQRLGHAVGGRLCALLFIGVVWFLPVSLARVHVCYGAWNLLPKIASASCNAPHTDQHPNCSSIGVRTPLVKIQRTVFIFSLPFVLKVFRILNLNCKELCKII